MKIWVAVSTPLWNRQSWISRACRLRHRRVSSQWWSWSSSLTPAAYLYLHQRAGSKRERKRRGAALRPLQHNEELGVTQTHLWTLSPHPGPWGPGGSSYLSKDIVSDRSTGARSWFSHFRQSRTIGCLLYARHCSRHEDTAVNETDQTLVFGTNILESLRTSVSLSIPFGH